MAMAQTGLPMIVSTGASTIEEVRQAVAWLRSCSMALLHCVSAYPVPDDHASLAGIRGLAGHFDVPIGYSDHTERIDSGGLAVAAGACILERHLTWNQHASGPDHGASLNPSNFRLYVQHIHDAARMLGSEAKKVLPIEQEIRRLSRQSVVITCNLEAGSCIEAEHLTVKRPGFGIKPARFPEVIGRTLLKSKEANTMLLEEDLA